MAERQGEAQLAELRRQGEATEAWREEQRERADRAAAQEADREEERAAAERRARKREQRRQKDLEEAAAARAAAIADLKRDLRRASREDGLGRLLALLALRARARGLGNDGAAVDLQEDIEDAIHLCAGTVAHGDALATWFELEHERYGLAARACLPEANRPSLNEFAQALDSTVRNLEEKLAKLDSPSPESDKWLDLLEVDEVAGAVSERLTPHYRRLLAGYEKMLDRLAEEVEPTAELVEAGSPLEGSSTHLAALMLRGDSARRNLELLDKERLGPEPAAGEHGSAVIWILAAMAAAAVVFFGGLPWEVVVPLDLPRGSALQAALVFAITAALGYVVRFLINARADSANARWSERSADLIARKVEHRVDVMLGRQASKFIKKVLEAKLEGGRRAQGALQEFAAFEADPRRGGRLRELETEYGPHAARVSSAAGWTEERPQQVDFGGLLTVLRIEMESLARTVAR